MRGPISKERLIMLFKMDGKPYLLQYEWRKEDYKMDKPLLNQMLKSKEIEMVERTTKKIKFLLLTE